MSAQSGIDGSSTYVRRLLAGLRQSGAQIVRAPSHSRRAEAALRSARHGLLMTVILGALIIVLMVGLDAREIGWMPERGTASLWPIRILTNFGKSAYVLWGLAGLVILVSFVSPAVRGPSRVLLQGLGLRLQFIFLAVLVPMPATEFIKWIVGRGRPFVGGEANAFNFSFLAGGEAYASFPSGHAVTAAALAFAVSAVWPQLRSAMIVYAILIALSRLVLLAHHPSDVVAGTLVGVVGAMAVRYWFAARRLGFNIRSGGAIVALQGPSLQHLKGVAREPSAP